MPKERFHLLLAEEALKVMGNSGDLPPLSREEKNGFLLGTLLPDVLSTTSPSFPFRDWGGKPTDSRVRKAWTSFKNRSERRRGDIPGMPSPAWWAWPVIFSSMDTGICS